MKRPQVNCPECGRPTKLSGHPGTLREHRTGPKQRRVVCDGSGLPAPGDEEDGNG